MNLPRLSEILPHTHMLFERAELEAAIDGMATTIAEDYAADPQPPLFVTVLHGGLLFSGQLGLALGERGLDVEFDYLHATRYRGETTGSHLAWLHRPLTPMRGRRVLLVDDILDEGHTLQAIQYWCEDQDPIDIKIAVLARKQHERCVDGVRADYIGVEVPDRYVFGYGMDFHEQGRNLPGIFALTSPPGSSKT